MFSMQTKKFTIFTKMVLDYAALYVGTQFVSACTP